MSLEKLHHAMGRLQTFLDALLGRIEAKITLFLAALRSRMTVQSLAKLMTDREASFSRSGRQIPTKVVIGRIVQRRCNVESSSREHRLRRPEAMVREWQRLWNGRRACSSRSALSNPGPRTIKLVSRWALYGGVEQANSYQ